MLARGDVLTLGLLDLVERAELDARLCCKALCSLGRLSVSVEGDSSGRADDLLVEIGLLFRQTHRQHGQASRRTHGDDVAPTQAQLLELRFDQARQAVDSAVDERSGQLLDTDFQQKVLGHGARTLTRPRRSQKPRLASVSRLKQEPRPNQ